MVTNLFSNLPDSVPEEITEELIRSNTVRIERIISTGQASPPGFWYDQLKHEYVVLLQGSACLEFEHNSVELKPGDAILIAPRQKHRVAWTSSDEQTIWLAIFFE